MAKKYIMWILIILLVLVLPGLYNRLLVRYYRVRDDKITQKIRIALVTDLHSCLYGEKQAELIDAITAQKPDLVMMAGDIFDDVLPNENTEYLLQGIAGKYPCYYVFGNHEYQSKQVEEKNRVLQKYGITVLDDTGKEVEFHGQKIRICGVNDPYAVPERAVQKECYRQRVQKLAPADNVYTVLLAHRPEYFPLYADCGFHLVLCGHAHGGQWRIPGIINGLYAPGQGIFPKYAGGLHRRNKTTLVVSRGLAREKTWVPRIYNRPELVIVDIG